MIPSNLSTPLSWKPFLLSQPLIPSFNIRCQAADLAGNTGPPLPRWLQSSGILDSLSSSPASPSSSPSNANKVDKIKMNAQKRRWPWSRESYLVDDSEPLPLPMTYPNSSPVSPEEIDRRLNCDVEVEDCKTVVYEWTGECRSCQGSGLVSYYNKKGKETICKCIPCAGDMFIR